MFTSWLLLAYPVNMRHFLIQVSVISFFGSALAFSSCENSDQWSSQEAILLRQAIDLERRHCQLKASIDSLWDATIAQLDRVLPPDLPPVDRNIFLKSRNADHIRMFMSFKQLDPKAQALVNQAGQQDEMLAAEAHTLLLQKQKFEQQKNQFLQKVERKDLAVSRMYAHQFRTAATQVCQLAPNHLSK